MLEIGIKGTKQLLVNAQNTAKSIGSGTLEVLSTPMMIALMEKTSYELVAPFLESGQGSVGTLVNIKHLAPTPIGEIVTCESTLIQIDGRRLVFSLKVFETEELVGEGIHERFIINEEKFIAKANLKKK
jgi:fluoroacetyl-CoA thioesterase